MTSRSTLALSFFAMSLGVLSFIFTPVVRANPIVGSSGFGFVSMQTFFDAVADARSAEITAYALTPNSDFVNRLSQAADGGAHIALGLDAGAFSDPTNANESVAPQLELQGISVHKLFPSKFHIAVLDGKLFISFRDWPAAADGELVLRDDNSGDARALEMTVLGGYRGSNDHLWMQKRQALIAEGGVIEARSADEVDVATGAIDLGTPVAIAIEKRIQDGDRVNLIVPVSLYQGGGMQRAALESLQRDGVQVRLGDRADNVAIDGYNCWYGTPDATLDPQSATEFAIAVHDPTFATQLHATFEAEWRGAKSAPRPRVMASPKHKPLDHSRQPGPI